MNTISTNFRKLVSHKKYSLLTGKFKLEINNKKIPWQTIGLEI